MVTDNYAPESEDVGYAENVNQFTAPVNSDTVSRILNVDAVILDIEAKLQGKVWNPVKQEYEQKYDAFVNDKGVSTLMIVVASHLNTNLILSNFDDKAVNRITLETANDIVRILFYRYKEFEVDTSHLSAVVHIIAHNIYATLRRSLKFGTFKGITVVTKRQENIRSSDDRPERLDNGGTTDWNFWRR